MAVSESVFCCVCQEHISPSSPVFKPLECFHTFHRRCILTSVEFGRGWCPNCRTQWRQLPVKQENPQVRADWSDSVFQLGDVELSEPAPTPTQSEARMQVISYTEYSTVLSDKCHQMDILVHLEATVVGDHLRRTPLDVVLVLDVSNKMLHDKIRMLKKAAVFMALELGSQDRLAVISFSDDAKTEMELEYMADERKTATRMALDTLCTRSGTSTDIVGGLTLGASLLEDRGPCNRASSILLLSYGIDDENNENKEKGKTFVYADLLPSSVTSSSNYRIPIHTFGFGSDHEAARMREISKASHGTYSFIETIDDIGEAFGQCLGGLLSIVFRDITVQINCADPGVHIVGEVKSGAYPSGVDDGGRNAFINIPEMYAFESRDFILSVSVPIASDAADTTVLLYLKTIHTEAVSQETVESDRAVVKVGRPVDPNEDDATPCVKVNRQMNRFEACEAMTSAEAAAARREYAQAAEGLNAFLQLFDWDEDEDADHELSELLKSELQYMMYLVEDPMVYRDYGRAFILSRIDCHSQQRATMQPRNPSEAHSFIDFLDPRIEPFPYQTKVMKKITAAIAE